MFRRIVEGLSLRSFSLSFRFWAGLALMAILPLLLAGYLVGVYIPPALSLGENLLWMITVTLIIASLGMASISAVVRMLSRLSAEASRVAEGKLNRPIQVGENGEIGHLADSLNRIQERMQQGMSEARNQAQALQEVSQENVRLYQNLEASYVGILAALAATVEAKDSYTKGHSERVAKYAALIGWDMGLREAELEILANAAILHDIGKIGVSDQILQKKGRLTGKEWETLKIHPLIGKKIVTPVEILKDVVPIVYYHHERYDGTGYPEGLEGKEIPLGARILAVADAFEAMGSERVYRHAFPSEEIVVKFKEGSGTQFDPEVVRVFLAITEDGRILEELARVGATDGKTLVEAIVALKQS